MIDFNRPALVGDEMKFLTRALFKHKSIAGNGTYCRLCADKIKRMTGAREVLLTHSGTAALEMAAILLQLKPGDEVILPSFTFVSSANALVLRGATPVFVDIRTDTLNIDESKIVRAITPRTRAVMVVHYGGVGCEMTKIQAICRRYNLKLIEDAAHALGSSYKGKALGGFGCLSALSFHETKNIQCGEGGALLINDPAYLDRAHMIYEKGTDRRRFIEGKVDKYTWRDVGSSYALSDLNAAYLYAQLSQASTILNVRKQIYNFYHRAFKALEKQGKVRLPFIPVHCKGNGHLFYLICPSIQVRDHLIEHCMQRGVQAVFHYIPLHSAPMGRKLKNTNTLPNTENMADRLVRLPMYFGMTPREMRRVASVVNQFFTSKGRLDG